MKKKERKKNGFQMPFLLSVSPFPFLGKLAVMHEKHKSLALWSPAEIESRLQRVNENT